jgi:RNA polymerase sigma-70 factor
LSDAPSVLAAFLEALPDVARAGAAANEREIVHMIETARAAWPAVVIDDARFVRYVAERAKRPLAELETDELYLACALAGGDRAALEAFDRTYGGVLSSALRQIRAPNREELEHDLRAKLFVGDQRRPPRIAEYAGTGGLKNWLRVVAVREALMRARKPRREIALEDDELALRAIATDDQDLEHQKALYAPKFKEAFQRAFLALEDRDKIMLRCYYLDGLTADEIGAMMRLHRTTITRQLGRVREKLLVGTRAILTKDLDAAEADQVFTSIVRALESRWDVSLMRLFTETDL